MAFEKKIRHTAVTCKDAIVHSSWSRITPKTGYVTFRHTHKVEEVVKATKKYKNGKLKQQKILSRYRQDLYLFPLFLSSCCIYFILSCVYNLLSHIL